MGEIIPRSFFFYTYEDFASPLAPRRSRVFYYYLFFLLFFIFCCPGRLLPGAKARAVAADSLLFSLFARCSWAALCARCQYIFWREREVKTHTEKYYYYYIYHHRLLYIQYCTLSKVITRACLLLREARILCVEALHTSLLMIFIFVSSATMKIKLAIFTWKKLIGFFSKKKGKCNKK